MWQSIKFMHRCFSWASQFSQCSLACAAESRVLRRGRWSSAAFRVRGHQSHWILFSFAFHHNLHFTHRFLCQDLQNFNQYLTMLQLVSKTQFGCSENQLLSFCGRLCSSGSSRGLSAPAASNELWRATQYQLWCNIVTDWKLLALQGELFEMIVFSYIGLMAYQIRLAFDCNVLEVRRKARMWEEMRGRWRSCWASPSRGSWRTRWPIRSPAQR